MLEYVPLLKPAIMSNLYGDLVLRR
jgi:hypothetical protein